MMRRCEEATTEASFRPTEAVHETVDSATGFWLTKAAAALFR